LPRVVRMYTRPFRAAAKLHGGIGGDAVGGIEDEGLGDGAEHGQVLQRHLRGPVLADRDAGVRAAELHVRARDAAMRI